jgi:hypothetical protein
MRRARVRQAYRCLSATDASLQLPYVQVATVVLSASFLTEMRHASVPLATRGEARSTMTRNRRSLRSCRYFRS